MQSGKKTTSFSFFLKAAFLLVGTFFLQQKVHAQANDLMIVEYVDWSGGSGFAVKIYNPTPNPINLSGYKLRIFSDARSNVFNDSDLLGTLAPCSTIVVGNDQYADNNCNGSANKSFFTPFAQGVNGNDLPAIIKMTGATTYVITDMIGRIGFDPGNSNSQKIGNTTDALFEKKIRRNQDNLSRYTLSSGSYNPTNLTTANIWPADKTTSVLGWTVVGSGTGASGCLAAGLPLTWTLPNLIFTNTSFTSACPVTAPGTISIDPQIKVQIGASFFTPTTVTWSGGTGTFANVNAATAVYTPGPGEQGTFTVTVTATYMCKTQTQVITVVNGTTVAPTLTANNITNDCRKDSIELIANTTALPNFEWKTSNGKGTFRNKNATTTIYKVAANDFTQLKFTANVTSTCFPTVVVPVTVLNGKDSLELASGFVVSPQPAKINEAVTFSYISSRPQTDIFGNWNYGDGTTTTNQQGNQQHTFTAPGTYTVSVDIFNNLNCPKGRFTQEVVVGDPVETIIPNLFTPNNDGINDTYVPQFRAAEKYELKVYNRWGQLIFETSDQQKGWDGKDATDGVYFVYINAEFAAADPIKVKLPVTLVR